MHFADYFWRANATKHAEIKPEWVMAVLESPIAQERQPDGRLRIWGRVDTGSAYGVRVIRVVLVDDDETVFNAFFDRNFRSMDR